MTFDDISTMQESLRYMTSSLKSNQALQASALVGRTVLVHCNQLQLPAEGSVTIAMDTPANLETATAFIYSTAGALIKTIPLGQPPEGFFQFCWDGLGDNHQRMTQGTYRVEICGLSQGKEVFINTMTSANIDSVSLGQHGEGLKLTVSGIGAITLDEVRQVSI
jgi:flagellar basal-body rod modification protein FlgD